MTFKCAVCRETKPVHTDGGTGYSSHRDRKICYACCGRSDTRRMERGLPVLLYYHGGEVSNWPGTLKIKASYTKKGNHNIARTRTDVWFNFVGKRFHGTQYGEYCDILRHVKAIKA